MSVTGSVTTAVPVGGAGTGTVMETASDTGMVGGGGSSVTGPDGTTLGTHSLPHLTRDWIRLGQEIDALSAEIKAKRRRMKETRAMILQVMRGNSLGTLNMSTGHVVREAKETRAAISKKYLNSTLVEFFEGDAVKARACAEWIESHRPVRNVENLSLRPK